MKLSNISKILCGCALLLASCSPVPDTPISQQLSPAEVDKTTEKIADFPQIYQLIAEHYESLDEVDKSRFGNLTYRQLTDFYLFANDSTKWSQLRADFRDEWLKQYRTSYLKADSIIGSWRAAADTVLNLPTKFVSVTISQKGYDDGEAIHLLPMDITNTKTYMVKPLTNDKLEDLRFYWNNTGSNRLIEGYVTGEITEPTHPTAVYGYVNFPVWAGVGRTTMDIESLTINGRSYPGDVLLYMPEAIKNVYFGDAEQRADYHGAVKAIALEMVDSSYVSQEDFVYLKSRETLEKKDAEAYAFFYESSPANPDSEVVEFVTDFYNNVILNNPVDQETLLRNLCTDQLVKKLEEEYAFEFFGEDEGLAVWLFLKNMGEDYAPQATDGLKGVEVDDDNVVVTLQFGGLKKEVKLKVVDTIDGLRLDDVE